ncbi:MAG: protein-L-isoaspartate O-methyltransferase [Devosiaceae bacterium]|nr:protein-L-isoaspartate O-methyltransferase [Devosiaceae bacterium]
MKIEYDQTRKNMVDNQLLTNGVIDHDLLASMGNVPREYFAPKNYQGVAYSDMDIKLDQQGRYLMAPVSIGRLVQTSQIDTSDVVLVVGSGIGYSLAIIANLASAVVGVEQNGELVEQASQILVDLDVGNGVVIQGDISKGLPSEAPYDVIIIEGSVDNVPASLFKQLRDGGRLIAAINQGAIDIVTIYKKTGEDIGSTQMFDIKLPALYLTEKASKFNF